MYSLRKLPGTSTRDPQVEQQRRQPGVTQGPRDSRIGPASSRTRTELALTSSITSSLNSSYKAYRLLEHFLSDLPFRPEAMDPKVSAIALKWFGGSGALMRAAPCTEMGFARVSFEVPTQRIDMGEVSDLFHLLKSVSPEAAIDFLAIAAMGAGQSTEAKVQMLTVCHATMLDEEIMFSEHTLNCLASGLQQAWRKSQGQVIEQIAQILCGSMLPARTAESLAKFLVAAFDQALNDGDRVVAEKAIKLLNELPASIVRQAAEEPLADLQRIQAEDDLDDATGKLIASGFNLQMEDRSGFAPTKLLNTGFESDVQILAFAEYAIKLAAVPAEAMWAFAPVFAFLCGNAPVSKYDHHAVRLAHCRLIAHFVRSDDPNAAEHLLWFRQDLTARLCDALETMIVTLDSQQDVEKLNEVGAWAIESLRYVANKFFSIRTAAICERLEKLVGHEPEKGTQGAVHELLKPFLAECQTVCAYAGVAPDPGLLMPIFKLVLGITVRYSTETVAICLDCIENPKSTHELQQNTFETIQMQVEALSLVPDESNIILVEFRLHNPFFHRMAKAAFLIDAISGLPARSARLHALTPSRVYERDVWKMHSGFFSTNLLTDIADHIIKVAALDNTDSYGPAPFFHEAIGEYLRRVLEEKNRPMREKAGSALRGLISRFRGAFTSLVLGATHGGKVKEIHELLELRMESPLEKAELEWTARFVSDAFLEMARSNDWETLVETFTLIREQWTPHMLQILAVIYVQAKAREQPLLARLVRLEMSRPYLDRWRAENSEKAAKMASVSLFGIDKWGESPRRPRFTRPDDQAATRLMQPLLKLLKFPT